MKRKKILVGLLAGAMVISMAACSKAADKEADSLVKDTGQEQNEQEQPTKQADEKQREPQQEAEEASIDFEDGKMEFVSLYTQSANADHSELAVVDYNGSKALRVKNVDGKVPHVAFDISGLLGSNVEKVASIEMTVGTEYTNGKFSASSGKIVSWAGEDLTEHKYDFAVYLESKNPNKAVGNISEGEGFRADSGNIFMVVLDTDNGVSEGNGSANLYIDRLRFLDANGQVLKADTSVAFAAPAGFENSGRDLSNLAVLVNPVSFEGFALKGDGWAQNGLDIPQEVLAAMVPGSVVEIEFASETGDMWIVLPDNAAGWTRVGDNGGAYVNSSKNVAQITYEQIAALCGEDTSKWGVRLQAESSGAWEVFRVNVGQKAPVYGVSEAVEFAGFAVKGDGWAQNGMDMPREVIDALVPGSAVELEYTSESGKLWIVLPDNAAGWTRVGDGNNGAAVCYNGKAYLTYEQITQFCGEDVSAWGARLQAESDSPWEVYKVRVGKASEMAMVNKTVNFEGFSVKGDGWAQNGMDIPQEVLAALVPGSVLTLNFTSESGKLWIVLPDSTAGWTRVGDGTNGSAAVSGGICQITYEQIARFCTEDVSTWGARLQAESDSPWEVFSVGVGMAAK